MPVAPETMASSRTVAHTPVMVFRFLRLFLLRYLPRRLFTILSVVEFVMLARRVYRATSPSTPPEPRVVGRSGFDDDQDVESDRQP